MPDSTPRATRPMATKAGDAPAARGEHRRLWIALLAVALAAAFVALDQWRTAQPLLTPAGPSAAAAVGRNTPQPRTNLGIIPGHNRVRRLPSGEFERVLEPDPVTGLPPDSGATCKDGTTEAEITWNVAQRVAGELQREGQVTVELLSEFDPQRAKEKFFGLALISIHIDACLPGFSGFKVAHIVDSGEPGVEDSLVNCLRDNYKAVTGLQEHTNTITPDMQYYHAFNEITPTTPGAIIELGFLNDDKEMLKQGDLPVKGVLAGIHCFIDK